jgi:hypothetical protein
MYLGKALARDQQLALATEVLDSLSRRARPGNPSDQAYREVLTGEVVLARGLADSAATLFRLAMTVDSAADFVESFARALAAKGDLAGAAKAYESIAAEPGSSFGFEAEEYALTAWRDAGAVYERLGDVTRARNAYERQLSLWAHPDSDLVSLRDARLGLARVTRGRLQPAGR